MPTEGPMSRGETSAASNNGDPKLPVRSDFDDGEKSASQTETLPTVDVEYQGVELKKSITFVGAVAIMLGNIGGASIFIAPTTILTLTGSPGLAVLMWCVGGLVTLSIAVSVCELALLLPRAGGPYIYALQVFGNIPGFIVLWGFVILLSLIHI